jgi:glycosyltransferase involved in cell wall biosynthesis
MVQLAAAIGIDARRVPLGIARNDWPPLAPRARGAGEIARLVQVASLNRVKDIGTTVEAMRLLVSRGRAVSIDFIGEDTLNGEVQGYCARLGLTGQTTFHGFLTQRELRPVMERAHLHIVSSRHEAGPAAALEAAFVGVPTVGTRVGHIWEWSGLAALAVPVRDAAALANAIEQLLDDDAARLRLAREAQRRALAEDADHTAAQFEAMYHEVTGR